MNIREVRLCMSYRWSFVLPERAVSSIYSAAGLAAHNGRRARGAG